MSPQERKQVMLRWAQLIELHQEELAALDCVDAGKPITECLNTDMPATIETFIGMPKHWTKCLEKLRRQVIRRWG